MPQVAPPAPLPRPLPQRAVPSKSSTMPGGTPSPLHAAHPPSTPPVTSSPVPTAPAKPPPSVPPPPRGTGTHSAVLPGAAPPPARPSGAPLGAKLVASTLLGVASPLKTSPPGRSGTTVLGPAVAPQAGARPSPSTPPAGKSPSARPARARGGPRVAPPPEPEPAVELAWRADHLKSRDPVGAARAFVERGLFHERIEHDRKSARQCYEAARTITRAMPAVLTRCRRLLEGRMELATSLEIVDEELSAADDDATRADLLAERARHCEVLGKNAEARKAYGEALALVPMHAASLRGLEALLRRELVRGGSPPLNTTGSGLRALASAGKVDLAPAVLLAAHLDHLARAIAPAPDRSDGDPRLAAWVHVERAEVLDKVLHQPQQARAALDHAVAFDPSPGPVRDAMTRHLVVHAQQKDLVESLTTEAAHERDDARGSRLLYTAARLLVDAVDSPLEAIGVLQRAAPRAPAGSSTQRRVLTELVRLLEAHGQQAVSAEVRQKALALLRDPEAIAHEHVRLCEIFDSIGQADRAAEHARQALTHDPDDKATRERLDRALMRLGRHEERVAAWVAEANSERPTPGRVAGFLRAADIAERQLRRRGDAIAYLRAAWALDPGNREVFDALSGLLAPPPRDVEQDVRAVRSRLDLYLQAASATTDPARRIGLLEKAVTIWEDELVQPARAIEIIEQILEIDPKRRSAILALQRNAERAGDARRLAQAFEDEANLTGDGRLQRGLLLQAADVLADRIGDRERAYALVERALTLDATNPDALRTKVRLLEKTGRHEEAKNALLALVGRDPQAPAVFGIWIEIARLDEVRLKRPHEAVRAYQEAARIRPRHPLPKVEIARLLRDIGDWASLVEALMALAADAADPIDYARLLFQAAEVQELCLRDDDAALKSLAQADQAIVDRVRAGGATGVTADDPAMLEAMERIHVRRASGADLAALYTRWLERHPPASVDHGIRIGFAGVLAETDRKQAVELLDGLIGVVPSHVPALRMLEHLHRSMDSHTALASTLRAEADVFTSAVARAGALWELVALEEQVGAGSTLDALERIVLDIPTDTAALDSVVRIASKLVEGVGVPHPAALATRARLVAALASRKQLARDPTGRALYQIEEAILGESFGGDDPTHVRAALEGYRAALRLWPESLLAARGLDRLAQRTGDRAGMLQAQLALAKLVQAPVHRAARLVRAAELVTEEGGSQSAYQALELYEDALRADSDNASAAAALARLLAHDTTRLCDRLGEALDKATASEQIVLLGTEIGRASLRPSPPEAGPGATVGIEAMRRVLVETPDSVSALLLMSSLLSEAQLWADARDTLRRVVEVAADAQSRVAAHFELATIFEGPLGDSAAAEKSLDAILGLEPKNRLALERLFQIAVSRGDRPLAISALSRLAANEVDPTARAEYDLRLAEACREGGDKAGMVRALCDAVVSAPADPRAWKLLASLQRNDTTEGAAAYAKSLTQLVEMATARRAPLDPRWLVTLGLLEATVLRRPADAVGHLQQAVQLPGAGSDARVALGRGLEAVGRNAEAVNVLREVLTSDAETLARVADLPAALSALEAALAKDGRAEERLAIEEVRACLGEVKGERVTRLRARRLGPEVPLAGALAGSEIARLLVPEARSPMIDVCVAIAPIAAKVLRFELASLGVSSRDRVGPRDGHPTRLLGDRLARALGVEAYEVYLTPGWQGAARVYPGDPPAIVANVSFGELPEPEQTFALGRLLTRIALGLAWLDELSIEAADGLLLSALRQVEGGFGGGEIGPAREHAAQGFLGPMQKAIGRRQRKLLEEIAPSTTAGYDARAFTIGVRRSEYRAAYVLSGDLVSAMDYLRRFDREINRAGDEPRVLLQHPVTNELVRFALTAEAYAERRRLGTVWIAPG